MLTYRSRITRRMLQAEPDTLFVFGDNMQRAGYGGQAKEMRGEPNSVGIPTKWRPSSNDRDFFTDDDLLTPDVHIAIRLAFDRLEAHPGPIVWPKDGIGTGLARLPEKAPAIWAFIEAGRLALEQSRALQAQEEGR